MQVGNCTVSNMNEIFKLYAIAAAHQQSRKTVVL